MNDINYTLILLSGLAAISSPGPATLAIAETSMSQGRKQGLMLAFGVLTGSIFWSTVAAFGLAAILYANVWLFEVMRYVGAAYLLYLAYKSMRSAFTSNQLKFTQSNVAVARKNYAKGLLIHLTNPKAILFFGALYSLGVPVHASASELVSVIVAVGVLSASIFLGYAVLFSSTVASSVYIKAKPVFEGVFAMFFGFVAIRLLTSELRK